MIGRRFVSRHAALFGAAAVSLCVFVGCGGGTAEGGGTGTICTGGDPSCGSPPPPQASTASADVPFEDAHGMRRDWLYADGHEAHAGVGYGYVVIPQLGPLDAPTKERVCGLFGAYATLLQESGPEVEASAVYFVTYWPLTSTADAGKPTTCDQAIAQYDRARVSPLVDCLGLTGQAGPYLVAAMDSLTPPLHGEPRLVLDLSNVDAAKMSAPVTRWATFTQEPLLQGLALTSISDTWQHFLMYVSQGTFQSGTAKWVKTCVGEG